MANLTADPLVSTAWLANRLGDPGVAILDATWFMPGTPRDPRAEYRAEHIPGAGFFGIDEISDHSSDLPHMLAAASDFQLAMRDLGINADTTVVVYDTQGLFSAPRAWWNFRAMGHESVFVLDGGLPTWKAEGRPLETGERSGPPGDFRVAPEARLVRDLKAVAKAIELGSPQLVDARPPGRFAGHAPEPREGLRSGHMPGALNLPFSLVVENGRLVSASRLETLFQEAGVDLEAPIITTCGSGISAAVLALALAKLGRRDVAVYDGSWTEWGGAAGTQVVQDPSPAS
jgi:thiosulfate/3-mercaptopyruvate sulfurtransferase